MHFFDPTLDWPKELLEEQMPDLVVIRSNNLKDPNAPWYGIDNAWRTSWIQFAAADGDHHFLSMTFLDGLSACNDDRKEVATYLTALSGSGVETRQYRSTSSVSNLPILSTASVIRCQPSVAADVIPVEVAWSLRYDAMDSTEPLDNYITSSPSLVVEPEDVDVSATTSLPPQSECTTPIAVGNDDPESSSAASSVVKLYVVASSSGVQANSMWEEHSEYTIGFEDIPMW